MANWIFHTPHLGMPPIEEARPASSSAGRSTPGPWANDIVRAQHVTYGSGEFIFAQAPVAVTRGQWVTYNTDDSTVALLVNAGTETQTVAVAMAPMAAGQWGWFQVGGKAIGQAAAGFADNALVYASATPGTVTSTATAGYRVHNAKGASAVGVPGAGLAEFEIARPWLTAGAAT